MKHLKVDGGEDVLPITPDEVFGDEDVQELVSTFVIEEREGTLSPGEIQKFKRHLSSCEACSEKYAVLTGFLGALESRCEQSDIVTADSVSKVIIRGGD